MVSQARFPFGRPSSRRAPRRPSAGDDCALFVLGAYPSALHVRWRLPDASVTVGALAVDVEPEVLWDGGDAEKRIADWCDAVGWDDAWGTVGRTSGNGSSGRIVADRVLGPLRIDPANAWFTDCVPEYLLRHGSSQEERIRTVYEPFAAQRAPGLLPAELPPRPSPAELVRRTLDEEASALRDQLTESRAPHVVTLGQEAADVFAELAGEPRIALSTDDDYGRRRAVRVGGQERGWTPLTHPGNRAPEWVSRHADWMLAVS